MAHAGGRPRTLDREALLPQLKEAFALGMPERFAADLVGIAQPTLHAWAEGDDDIAIALKNARAAGIRARLRAVKNGREGWTGSAWMLERRYSEYWGRQDRTPALDRDAIQRIVAEMRAESGMSEEEAQAAVEAAMSIISRAQELAPQRGRKRG